jgi:hypothetical protein
MSAKEYGAQHQTGHDTLHRVTFASTQLAQRHVPSTTGCLDHDLTSQRCLWEPLLSSEGRAHRKANGVDAAPAAREVAWSCDGKRLALTRSSQTNDIVLFNGLK